MRWVLRISRRDWDIVRVRVWGYGVMGLELGLEGVSRENIIGFSN